LWERELNSAVSYVPLDVIDTSNDIMLSGYSTTASAVESMLYVLALYSDEQNLVRKEVRSLTNGSSRCLNEQELSLAVYSTAFVTEVLRLYPPVSFIQRVANSQNQLDNSTFDEGSLILVSPWATHRHYKFWERPNHFFPQRWLDSSGSVAQKISDAQYLPFGKGHRGCPGEKLANTILLVMLTSIVQKFEIKAVTHTKVAWKSQLSLRSSKPISLLISKI
jgi:cytochrome P450